MGKAGRRKKNRQRRKQQLSSDPIQDSSTTATTTIIANPQSALHKLRHADPRVRHAALVALQASVLSQANCSHKPVSIKVLQAVREQVTSNDLECSAVAADCLAQYLLSISSSKNHNNNNSEPQKQTIASWALVLLGRLDDCRKALEEQWQQQQEQQSSKQSVSKNQQKKGEKTKKRWYAISAPCLIALCQLIEDNGHALDQINLQKKTFVQVIFGLLSLERGGAKSPQPEDTAMKDDNEEELQSQQQQDAIFAKMRDTTALYSARCLHSALDDNWELAEALTGTETSQQQLWTNLLQPHNGHGLSSMTRLHLIGCLVNLYQLSMHNANRGHSWYERAILDFGIRAMEASSDGLLLEVLQASTLEAKLTDHEARYRAAQALLEKQQRDQQLEEEIDAQVKERKEPAKLIARRQKKVKEAKREAFREQQKAKMIAEAESTDAEMMDASDHEDQEETNNKTENNTGRIIREQDGEEAKNEAILEWTGTTGPIQLSLEILTNLVSTWTLGGGGDEDDPMGEGGKPVSSVIFKATQGQNMASKLAQTFSTFSQFLRMGRTTSPDDPIRSDAEESIGKVAACIVNCFLVGILDNDEPKVWATILSDLWSELGQAAPSEMVLDAASSILAVAAEMNPAILRSCRNEIRGDHFSVFRKLLPRADAVSLLSSAVLFETAEAGMASAETEATIRCLTNSFLALLRPESHAGNPKTQTCILKAFMDWYGNDDFYPHLYESLGVSQVISVALESIARNQAKLDLDEEQLQILHNSGRFLDYKNNLKVQAR